MSSPVSSRPPGGSVESESRRSQIATPAFSESREDPKISVPNSRAPSRPPGVSDGSESRRSQIATPGGPSNGSRGSAAKDNASINDLNLNSTQRSTAAPTPGPPGDATSQIVSGTPPDPATQRSSVRNLDLADDAAIAGAAAAAGALGDDPTIPAPKEAKIIVCPRCGLKIDAPETKMIPKQRVWFIFMALFICMCWWISWLPFLCSRWYTPVEICPHCYRRIDRPRVETDSVSVIQQHSDKP